MKLDEYISRVPWNEVRVASGMAGHVPDALVGLLSPDEETQKRSYWQLDNEVVVQSDLYEAACYVIPILIRMLGDRAEHGRDRIYDLLYEIAGGYAPSTSVCRTRDGRLLALREACIEELNRGLSLFDRDMADEDPRIRAKAKELVDLLGESKPHGEFNNGSSPTKR